MGTVTPTGIRSDVTRRVAEAFAREGLPAMSEETLIRAKGGLNPRRLCPCHGTGALEHRQRVLAAETIRAEQAAAAAERTA